jgi:hypothetical protein
MPNPVLGNGSLVLYHVPASITIKSCERLGHVNSRFLRLYRIDQDINAFRIMCPTMGAEVWSNIDISPSLMLNRLSTGLLMKKASDKDRG